MSLRRYGSGLLGMTEVRDANASKRYIKIKVAGAVLVGGWCLSIYNGELSLQFTPTWRVAKPL